MKLKSVSLGLGILLLLPKAFLHSALAQEASAPEHKPVLATETIGKASPEAATAITDKQAHSFRAAFQALAKKAAVTFIVEAEPLHPDLEPNTPIGLTPGGEPLSTLVPKLAAAYDYEATRSGDVFVLTKLYTDPKDIPDVTLAECVGSMDDAALVLAPFNPHFNRGQIEKSPAMQDLLSSFTPEQIAALQDKQHGLAVASLPQKQQQEAEQLALFLYVQLPLGNAMPAMQQIKSIGVSVPVFRSRDLAEVAPGFSKINLAGITLFGIEFFDFATSKKRFIPLSKPDTISSESGGIGVTWGGFSNGKPVLPDKDPTDPPFAVVPPRLQTPKAANSETIQEIIARLNTVTHGKPKIVVDAALAPKRVAIFGERSTPPMKILNALADVYGLRVRFSDDEKTLYLTRRLFRVPLDPSGISLALQAVMPAPLVRARRNYLGRRPSPLRIEAVRLLRTVVEPKLKVSKTGSISLSDLSAQENMTLASALMSDAAGTLEESFSQPLPPSIFNPDLLRLTGTVQQQDGHRTLELFLALPSLDGKETLVQGPGVGNLVVAP